MSPSRSPRFLYSKAPASQTSAESQQFGPAGLLTNSSLKLPHTFIALTGFPRPSFSSLDLTFCVLLILRLSSMRC